MAKKENVQQVPMFVHAPVVGSRKCARCGRTLTDPASIAAGIGPICAASLGFATDHAPERNFDDYDPTPLAEGLVLRRGDGGLRTNVPHLCVHHSPTGFEWGFGGSGPADLALNLCEWWLQRAGYTGKRMKVFDGECFELAFTWHQEVKWRLIATAPQDGGVLPYTALQAVFASLPQEDDDAV